MSNLTALASSLATSLGMDDGSDLLNTLKATAFKGQVSDSQMTALLIVAKSYGLNPWTRELYAFPDKNNGIVPVVGVDGWARIINSHPQFDGMDFEQDAESCTCIIFRKDRGHPIRVTEWLSECKRQGQGPWTSHPKRMLRHKAMIQCARIAFGYGGIYDQDEAERIVEEPIDITPKSEPKAPAPLPPYDQAKFDANLPAWDQLIKSGKKSAEQVIKSVSTVAILTEAMKASIKDCEVVEGELVPEEDDFLSAYDKAQQGDEQ